jgi:hypothetical protein
LMKMSRLWWCSDSSISPGSSLWRRFISWCISTYGDYF